MIQEHVKKPLADELLFGGLVGGGRVTVIVTDDDTLGFELEARSGSDGGSGLPEG